MSGEKKNWQMYNLSKFFLLYKHIKEIMLQFCVSARHTGCCLWHCPILTFVMCSLIFLLYGIHAVLVCSGRYSCEVWFEPCTFWRENNLCQIKNDEVPLSVSLDSKFDPHIFYKKILLLLNKEFCLLDCIIRKIKKINKHKAKSGKI